MDYGSVVQRVVKQVIAECGRTNTDIQEDFCAYYVKLLKVDPNWCIADDLSYRQLDFEKFVHHIASKFEDSEDPTIKAIKLQYYCETITENLKRFTSDRREALARALNPLEALVLTYHGKKEDIKKKLDHLIHYLTLASGLGNPRYPKVYNEVKVVLKSVMDMNEFRDFLETEECVRREKLDVLLKTVAGIRIFNYHSLTYSHGISNLPNLLKRSITLLKQAVSYSLKTNKVEIRIFQLSEALDSCYVLKKTKTKAVLKCNLPRDVNQEDLDYAKLLLIIYHQFSKCISKLLEEIDKLEQRVLIIDENYHRMLRTIQNNVKRKTLISAAVHFPAFEKLYEWWKRFQEETTALTSLKFYFEEQFNLMKSIEFENSLTRKFSNDIHDTTFHFSESYAFHKELLAMLGLHNVKIYKKESFTNFNGAKLEYSGFCCWKLVSTNGVLSQGKADYGIIGYRNKYYIFCSSLGLQSFIKDPDYYILRVLHLARQNCELIVALDIRDQMKEYKHEKKIIDEYHPREAIIQSLEVGYHHFLEDSVERYDWNIWHMRKRGIQLANLKHCKTSSTQTVKSSFSNRVCTQTYPLKEQAIQTNPDAFTNTQRPFRYIAGLRGKKDSMPFCLNLTKLIDFDYENKNIK